MIEVGDLFQVLLKQVITIFYNSTQANNYVLWRTIWMILPRKSHISVWNGLKKFLFCVAGSVMEQNNIFIMGFKYLSLYQIANWK